MENTTVAAPPRTPLFIAPARWRTGEYLSLLGLGAMLLSVLGFSWVAVDIEVRDPFLGLTWVDQTLDFKVLENGELAAALIVFLALALLLLPWRRPVAWTGLFFCLALAGCFAYYVYGLIDQAYDILGLLKSVPLVGGMLVEIARDSIKAVRPQPGLYLFGAGYIVYFAGQVIRLGSPLTAR